MSATVGRQIVCEVCETPQAPASVCASCGMPLRVPPGVVKTADPVIEKLPDLEPTSDGRLGEVATVRVEGIEQTSQGPVGEIRREFVDGFEATASNELLDFLDGPDPVMDDIERTTDDFEKTTPAPAGLPDVCPYCAHPQKQGRLCDNCGRSRIRFLPNTPQVAAVARRGEAVRVRCRSCGCIVTEARLCSECGQPLPPPGGS